jgi:hypothetical protein
MSERKASGSGFLGLTLATDSGPIVFAAIMVRAQQANIASEKEKVENVTVLNN